MLKAFKLHYLFTPKVETTEKYIHIYNNKFKQTRMRSKNC